jgi:hypothetical protein
VADRPTPATAIDVHFILLPNSSVRGQGWLFIRERGKIVTEAFLKFTNGDDHCRGGISLIASKCQVLETAIRSWDHHRTVDRTWKTIITSIIAATIDDSWKGKQTFEANESARYIDNHLHYTDHDFRVQAIET